MTWLASLPTRPLPCSSNPLKYSEHITDLCFYKALTVHQLIQFRTPALPCHADRLSLAVLSGGVKLAALNALQDYSLHSSAAAEQSPPLSSHRHLCSRHCWRYCGRHSCVDRERTAFSFPLRLSRSQSADLETLVLAQWVTTVQCSTCRNWNAHPE